MGEERWGGKVTMISCGVEISIAVGGGGMLRGHLFLVFFVFFLVIMRSLFFGTKSLMQR